MTTALIIAKGCYQKCGYLLNTSLSALAGKNLTF